MPESSDRATPLGFKLLGVNHIGLAPKDPARARWFFTEALGLSHLGDELVPSQQTLTAMLASEDAGAAAEGVARPRLEILIPTQDAKGAAVGPIAQFLAKKGSGVHHIALAVSDVEKAVARMLALGVKMIDQVPRPGAHHTKIAFVHPEGTGGLLVELVEEAKA